MEISAFIDFRKELHQYPEVSGSEKETKNKVLNFIKRFHPNKIIETGKYGLIFGFLGKETGKSIMIRAELDALPIQETNEFKYKSVNKGVSHKCGHDGHMAILARLAERLSNKKPEKGNCYLLYQPAEETGEGAREIFHSEAFQEITIDRIIALHNIPSYPKSGIIIKENAFTPAVSSIIVKFKGKTSHAAEPEAGHNPAEAMALFLQESLNLSQSDPTQDDFFLVTPVYQIMGQKSYGVSAGYGEVHLTIRAWSNDLLADRSKQLEEYAGNVCGKYGLECDISRTQEFKANQNDPDCVTAIKKAATACELSIIERETPMKWGEDFGLLTGHIKGAMFGLGSGEDQPALHNPDYDFPDELIESGSRIFEYIVRDFLK
ncbi:MAG TPA: amidohydrolase [Edaphocola sp.]|nr:amidohydrolase [Edaphocola sp.]